MSEIAKRITEDMKSAMKARESEKLTLLRSLSAALKNAAIEKGSASAELEDNEVLAVIRKQVKQREDSETAFVEAGRAELAEKETSEKAWLETYLPQAMSEKETIALVESCIAEAGAESRKEMGDVMKLLQEKSNGRADNKLLSAEVMKRLS